ncbi:helix-turn-helix transcriptional regulator [Nocardioides hungaricus]
MTKTSDSSIRGHLDLLVIASLATTPSHGYALIDSLRRLSGGTLDFAEGSLYPVLHKLEHEGLIRSSWDRGDGRRRRVYRVTASGRRELAVRARRWRLVRDAVDAVLSGVDDDPQPAQL